MLEAWKREQSLHRMAYVRYSFIPKGEKTGWSDEFIEALLQLERFKIVRKFYSCSYHDTNYVFYTRVL